MALSVVEGESVGESFAASGVGRPSTSTAASRGPPVPSCPPSCAIASNGCCPLSAGAWLVASAPASPDEPVDVVAPPHPAAQASTRGVIRHTKGRESGRSNARMHPPIDLTIARRRTPQEAPSQEEQIESQSDEHRSPPESQSDEAPIPASSRKATSTDLRPSRKATRHRSPPRVQVATRRAPDLEGRRFSPRPSEPEERMRSRTPVR